MKIPTSKPEINFSLPESIDEDRLKQVAKGVLALTVAVGVYHHFSRSGKGFAYLRPSEEGGINFEIGVLERLKNGRTKVRQMWGEISAPEDDIYRIGYKSTIENLDNRGNLTPDEIKEAFGDELEDENPLQNG